MGQKIIKVDSSGLQTVNLSIFHKCWMCRWKDIFDCHIDCCIQTSHTSYYYTVTASRTGYSSYCEHSPVCRCTSACTASSWFAELQSYIHHRFRFISVTVKIKTLVTKSTKIFKLFSWLPPIFQARFIIFDFTETYLSSKCKNLILSLYNQIDG